MSIGAKPWEGGGAASVPDASETTKGKIRIATSAEAASGLDDLTAMTPLTVKERIDAALAGGVEYKGTFNATTGLTNSGGNLNNAEQGDLYVIDTLGTIYGQTWAVGDHLLINADMGGSITNSKIDKVDNTDAVTSVNTLTGPVVLNGGNVEADYTATSYIASSANINGHLEGIDDEFLLTATLASPDFSGTPTAPTATQGDNSTQIATTAYVDTAVAAAGGISSVVEDTTPQLGGDLDVNGQTITSASNGDVTIDPNGTGDLVVGADIMPDANATHYIGDENTRFISAYTDINGAIRFKAKNDQGASITKGQVLYIKGVSGTVPTVGLARANSASTMPAFGLALANANDQADVEVVTFGNLTDVNTTTYSLSAGDTVYVSAATAGSLTNSAPAGESNLIQNIGRVVRADASAGIIKVGGAGRSNATPNLDQDKIFVGNASNQAVSTALSAIDVGSFNDDSTYQPLDAGLTSISALVTAADKMIFTDGSDSYATTDLTAFARSFLDDANATTARSTLSLGTAATSDSGDFLASTAAVGDLSDVTITSVSNGQVLSYNSTSGDWENTTPASGGATDLDGLSDVTITSATGGDLLQNNGSGQFVNVAKSSIDVGTFNDDGTYLKNLSEDTTPQLSADLDVNGNAITSASNGLVEITPDGTGAVKLGGNTNPAELRFFDEGGNNYIALKAPADASISADETFTLPATDGTNGQVLQTNGSGVLSFVDQSGGGGGGGFTYNSAISATNAAVDNHYSCGAGNQTFTVTLPAASGASGQVSIKNMGTGTITVGRTGGDTIDGVASDYTLDIQYSAITLISNGSNGWEIR